jgi:hypothetical protein
MSILSVAFLKDAGTRALYTFAQTAVSILSGNAVGIVDIDFAAVANLSAGAALVSVLTSIVRWTKPEKEDNTEA